MTAPLLDVAQQQERDRTEAGPAWPGDKLGFTTRYGTRSSRATSPAPGTPTAPSPACARSPSTTDCGTLLADLDVHPRVAMQILRHADFALTMEIYTLASSTVTREALKRHGDSLDGPQ